VDGGVAGVLLGLGGNARGDFVELMGFAGGTVDGVVPEKVGVHVGRIEVEGRVGGVGYLVAVADGKAVDA
jgi:hypothetical protein